MKIGIIGTHGIGKTTLSYSLASLIKLDGQNVKVINEVVRCCPFPLNDGFTIEGGVWTICEQVRQELECIAEGVAVTICDRSALDPIFYLKARGIEKSLYADLERFAINWLLSYDRLIWVKPSYSMPLFDDGVRSVTPDFQRIVHDLIDHFFEEHNNIEYTEISSGDVFSNKIGEILELLCIEPCEIKGG